GDIDEDEAPQKIREIIRDEYLRDTSVLILLVGTETKNRKHVDWELYSSMRDSTINKKSGILVVNLPSTNT
ncbi:TIR domain-containing protein, partial [Klebsiella pneumoniae]